MRVGVAATVGTASALWFATAPGRGRYRAALLSVCLRLVRIPIDRALRNVRRRRLETSIPGSLRSLADSVDGGELLVDAAFRVGASGSASARELGAFARDCMRGSSLENALLTLTGAPNGDLWIPVAFVVGMHARCGGDLAASLRSVARSFELAQRSRAEAKAGTAQARFTGNLVCALPILAALGALVLMPDKVLRTLHNPISLTLLLLALGLQAISLLAIRRLAGAAVE